MEIAADVSTLVPDRVIDDNVHVLLRFANGARGSLWASQVAIGHLNSHQLRVYCEGGSIIWMQERPDVVFLDWALPGRSGVEVCREIRDQPRSDETTIIMLTGMSEGPAHERAVDAGADLFLTKPFSPLRLLRLVDELGAPGA